MGKEENREGEEERKLNESKDFEKFLGFIGLMIDVIIVANTKEYIV